MSSWSIKIEPTWGFRTLLMLFKRVVFPEPFGPKMPMKQPDLMSKLMSDRILTEP
jgi:hypothetical protein